MRISALRFGFAGALFRRLGVFATGKQTLMSYSIEGLN
jgi:hypothetical protein